MDRPQVQALCAGLAGATVRRYPDPGNIEVYSVDDKRVAYFKTSMPERWRFSVRVSPDRFLELTDVPGIKPARYFARFHWVTIIDVRSVPDAYLAGWVDWSHRKALSGLSARRRKDILG